MDYKLEWFDESQKILVIHFNSKVTWEEFHQIVDDAHNEVKAQPHSVDLLLWYKTGHLPRGNAMLHFKSVVARQPENIGKVIVINPDLDSGIGRYVLLVAKMMLRLVPQSKKVELVGSYEAACAKLNVTPQKV